MVRKELVAWHIVNKICPSLLMVSSLIWSSILTASLQEWPLDIVSNVSLERSQQSKVGSQKTPHLSDNSICKLKLKNFMQLASKNMVMSSCSTHTLESVLKISCSSGPFIIKDSDIWWMIKCMRDREVQWSLSLVSLLMDVAELEDSVSERWREIVSYPME